MTARSAAWCGVIAVAAIAAEAVVPGNARAGSVRTVAIRSGVTPVDLSVAHKTASGPPAIVLSTSPANLRCTVSRYSYHALSKSGRFRMRLRCRKVPRGARVRLVFRSPFLRVFPLRNGTGTIRVRLDKPPGHVLPLAQLTTRPRKTNCDATPTGMHTGTHEFTASARVRCRGLPANARGVLAVGGLLAAHRSAVTRSSRSQATTAAAKPCGSPRTLSLLGRSISWKYCYWGRVALGPWRSHSYGAWPNPTCQWPWRRASDVADPGLRVLLANLYPAAAYVEPTSAWAWGVNWFPVVGWYVTNWQFSGDITAQWQYNCYQLT
jgi:hypothetical protein